MPLSDYEIEWLTNSPAEKDLKKEVADATASVDAREEFLDKVLGEHLGKLQEEISDAQNLVLQKQSGSSAANAFWKMVLRQKDGKIDEMSWRADDSTSKLGWETRADVEVDTVEDLVGDVKEIPEEQLKALNASLSSILSIQNAMVNSFDENGNRQFTDKDIMKELWTPLVRAGTIPENMVPDKFSEQAHAFDGAAEIYNDKLKAFAANSTGHEGLMRGLYIAKETLSTAGTLVTKTFTAANAMAIAQDKADLAKVKNDQALDGTVLEGDDKKKKMLELNTKIKTLQNQEKIATVFAAMTNGGLDLTISGVREGDKEKQERDWMSFAEKAIVTFSKVASAAVGPLTTVVKGPENIALAEQMAKSDDSTRADEGKAFLANIKAVKSVNLAILAGITGARIGPTLVRAYRAPNRKMTDAIIEELAGHIGDAISTAINSVAASMGKDAGATMTQIGAAISSSIKAAGKGAKINKLLEKGDYKAAAMLLGGTAVQAVLSVTAEPLYDVMRRDLSKADYNALSAAEKHYAEPKGAAYERTQDLASAAMIKKLSAAMKTIGNNLPEGIDSMSEPILSADEQRHADELREKIEEKARLKAEEALKKEFGDPENVRKMLEGFEENSKHLEKIYADVMPDDQLLDGPPDEVARSLDSIDRAIERSQALRAKAEMINTITSTGASVLATFIPGAGVVVAAQKLAFDIYCLVKAVQLHNKWCDSMEVSFRANSAFGPAIERTMKNARIMLSETSIKVALDSIQLGAQAAKIGDPTGASTVASAVVSMTSALTDYAYKMHNENAIRMGWNAYKSALENPGSRKRARKALRLNSTLAKCCIAYGATMGGDAAAKEAIRRSGLTLTALVDDKDVCNKLVAYLQDQLRGDPNEMKVRTSPAAWQPGRPMLTPASWFSTKAAATKAARPRLSPDSLKTPSIDMLVSKLAGKDYWNGKISYLMAREALSANGADEKETGGKKGKKGKKDKKNKSKEWIQYEKDLKLHRKHILFAEECETVLVDLKKAFAAYRPLEAGKTTVHKEMAAVVSGCSAIVQINLNILEKDIQAKEPTEPKESSESEESSGSKKSSKSKKPSSSSKSKGSSSSSKSKKSSSSSKSRKSSSSSKSKRSSRSKR